jgi:5-oxoprolinase (ATP-hydrolysing) subunit A
MYKVDLNSDLGESYGNFKVGEVDEILECISSANIACGYHAGDHNVMLDTVLKAKAKNVAIGAHPGFNDLFGFGRRLIPSTPKEIYNMVIYQVGALIGFCKINNVKMQHVKPHGALYNHAAVNRDAAKAICDAVKDLDSSLILFGLSGSIMIEEAKKLNLKVGQEVFADRNYMNDGTLTPRTMKNAMIHDENIAVQRVIGMITENKVKTVSGKDIHIEADTICVHGDGSKALLFTQKLKKELQDHSITIEAIGC